MEASKIESQVTSNSYRNGLKSNGIEDSDASSFNPELLKIVRRSSQQALTRNSIALGRDSIGRESIGRESQEQAASLLKDKSHADSLYILAHQIESLKEMER